MADRFPLILNTTVNQIQEIPSGDQLDLTGNNIANAGIVTASAFHGDGSQLTGVTSVGGNNGVDFNDDIKARFGDANELTLFFQNAGNRGKFGTTNSTALDILTANTQRVVIENSGHVRPAINNTYDLGTAGDRWRNINGVTGNFSGNLTVGGVLTYEDVTNIDSVGLITARTGVVFQGNATFGNNIKSVYNSNLEIYNDGSNRFKGNSGGIFFGQPGSFLIGDGSFANTRFEATGTHAILYSAGVKVARSHQSRFEVGNPDVGIGIAATITTSGDARFVGIITATNFVKADGSSLGGVVSDTNSNTVGGTAAGVNFNTSGNVAQQNTLFGFQAGNSIDYGDGNTVFGYQAMLLSTGEHNTVIGWKAADSLGASSNANVFIGKDAAGGLTGGCNQNIAIGSLALNDGNAVSGNICLGGQAGKEITGNFNVCLGYYAGGSITSLKSGENNIIIGKEASPSNEHVSNEITLGNTGITTFRMPGIGVTFTNNGTGAQFDGAYNFARTDNSDFIQGVNAQARPADGAGWNDNLILGRFAGEKLAAGSYNCLVGFRAGKETTDGSYNTFVGYYAGIDHTGTRTGNTVIGARAGYNSGQGDHNIIIGHQADVSSNGESRQIILGKPASVTNFPTDFKIPALNFHLKQTTDTTTGNILTLQSDGSSKFTPFAPSIVTAVGLSTFSGGLNLGGMLSEEVNIVVGKLSDNSTIKLEDGMVHYFTVAETTSTSPTFTFSSSVNLATKMSIGEMVSVTVIITPNGAGYSGGVLINGSGGTTTNWVGGNAPTSGGASGVDIYSYNIIKTGSTAFVVIANLTQTS
jgi:hypothetical protein